jgi:hypothetical protein
MSEVTVIDKVIDALVAKANSLTAITSAAEVTDGYPVTDSVRTFLAFGVDDPGSTSQASSASSQNDWHAINTYKEEGEVVCAVSANDGTGNTKTARDAAFGIMRTFQQAIRTDYQLSAATIPGLVNVQFGHQINYYSNQTQDLGAEVTLVFRITFEALS